MSETTIHSRKAFSVHYVSRVAKAHRGQQEKREKRKKMEEIGSAVGFKPISKFPPWRCWKAACDQGKYVFSFLVLSILIYKELDFSHAGGSM